MLPSLQEPAAGGGSEVVLLDLSEHRVTVKRTVPVETGGLDSIHLAQGRLLAGGQHLH